MSLLTELTRLKGVASIVGGVFMAGGSAYTYVALRGVATRDDLRAAVTEHAAHPHPLSTEEQRLRDRESFERGKLKEKVDQIGESVKRIEQLLLERHR